MTRRHYHHMVIRAMHDNHLINALLKALSLGDTPEDVAPLTAEVVRRNIQEKAFAEVNRRTDAGRRA